VRACLELKSICQVTRRSEPGIILVGVGWSCSGRAVVVQWSCSGRLLDGDAGWECSEFFKRSGAERAATT